MDRKLFVMNLLYFQPRNPATRASCIVFLHFRDKLIIFLDRKLHHFYEDET